MPQVESDRQIKKRQLLTGVVIAFAVVVLVAAGGVTAALLLTRSTPEQVKPPRTAAELRNSVEDCEGYLSDKGKALAGTRDSGGVIYSVEARLDTEENEVSGEEIFLYTNNTGVALNEIVMRVYANGPGVGEAGREARVTDIKASGREAKGRLNGSILTIDLPEELAPGEDSLVSLSFEEYVPEVSGILGDIGGMLGGNSEGGYGVFGQDGTTYNLGYLMPMVVVNSGGTWDTRQAPAFGDVAYFDCAYFNVSLDVPEDYVVAATGVETTNRENAGRRTYTFACGPVRDFCAVASSVFRVETREVGPTLVSSYYEKGSRSGKKVLDITSNALNQFNKHFGQYPYVRLNVAQSPLSGGAAGMEFSGQIMIAGYLYGASGLELPLPDSLKGGNGEGLSDLLDSLGGSLLGDTLEFVIAHEVGHQWWGMVVGSDSMAHPWQDESLTNYCAVLYFRWQHGEEAAESQLNAQIVLPYSMASALAGGDAVVDSPLDSFENQSQYTAIVYSKGALFFNELEKQMGASAFDEGLSSYFEQYAFLIASPSDLIEALAKASSDPSAVAALHQRWIKEKHADVDIEASGPGGDLLDEFMNILPEDLDLGPLQEMLKDLMDRLEDSPEGSLEETPPPSTEPVIPI